MHGLPFTLRQLEVFERLCELRSFRLASENLGISQASVSNQLKALEDQMGMRLLIRESGKRPQLTPAGAAFLADLGEFWKAAEALAAHRRSTPLGGNETLHLRVMAGTYLLKDYVRPKLAGFFDAHPKLMLDFYSPGMNEPPHQAIVRESFDLGLFQDNAHTPLPAGCRRLTHVRSGVYGHRKFAEGASLPLTAEEVSKLPFLLPSAGSYYEGQALEMLARHGVKPARIIGRMPYFDVMSSMLDGGSCVGVTLQPLVDPDKHANTVLLFPLDDWQLTSYRNPRLEGAQADAAEAFLVSSVIDDPAYPRLNGKNGKRDR